MYIRKKIIKFSLKEWVNKNGDGNKRALLNLCKLERHRLTSMTEFTADYSMRYKRRDTRDGICD